MNTLPPLHDALNFHEWPYVTEHLRLAIREGRRDVARKIGVGLARAINAAWEKACFDPNLWDRRNHKPSVWVCTRRSAVRSIARRHTERLPHFRREVIKILSPILALRHTMHEASIGYLSTMDDGWGTYPRMGQHINHNRSDLFKCLPLCEASVDLCAGLVETLHLQPATMLRKSFCARQNRYPFAQWMRLWTGQVVDMHKTTVRLAPGEAIQHAPDHQSRPIDGHIVQFRPYARARAIQHLWLGDCLMMWGRSGIKSHHPAPGNPAKALFFDPPWVTRDKDQQPIKGPVPACLKTLVGDVIKQWENISPQTTFHQSSLRGVLKRLDEVRMWASRRIVSYQDVTGRPPESEFDPSRQQRFIVWQMLGESSMAYMGENQRLSIHVDQANGESYASAFMWPDPTNEPFSEPGAFFRWPVHRQRFANDPGNIRPDLFSVQPLTQPSSFSPLFGLPQPPRPPQLKGDGQDFPPSHHGESFWAWVQRTLAENGVTDAISTSPNNAAMELARAELESNPATASREGIENIIRNLRFTIDLPSARPVGPSLEPPAHNDPKRDEP